MNSKKNARKGVSMYSRCLILLSIAHFFLFSMLFWSNNLMDLKINTVLAIPNVPGNNDTSSITSTTTTNYPPEAAVGPDQTVNEDTTVILVGGASDRNTNDKLSYSWTQTAGPPIALNGSNTTSATFISPTVSSDTILKFSLTAKDDKGATSVRPTIATVIVKPVNNPPNQPPLGSPIPTPSGEDQDSLTLGDSDSDSDSNRGTQGQDDEDKEDNDEDSGNDNDEDSGNDNDEDSGNDNDEDSGNDNKVDENGELFN